MRQFTMLNHSVQVKPRKTK